MAKVISKIDLIRPKHFWTIVAIVFIAGLSNCNVPYTGPQPENSPGKNQTNSNNNGQMECTTEQDCLITKGALQQGLKWVCQNNKCISQGSTDPANNLLPGETPIEDPNCLASQLGKMTEGLCSCMCDDCDCKTISCECDQRCYQKPPPSGCVIDKESNNQTIDNTKLEDCQIDCIKEGDLTETMPCKLNNCVTPANAVNVDVQPEAAAPGATANLLLEREIRDVDVLFVVDNSGSMADDQLASACAMEKFLDAASAGGAEFDTGVITTDISDQNTSLLGIANSGRCKVPKNCQCKPNGQFPDSGSNSTIIGGIIIGSPVGGPSTGCRFNKTGEWINTSNPSNWDTLKKTIVQGSAGFNQESGLQTAFRQFAKMEIDGTFKGPYETVVISDEYAHANHLLCPFTRNNSYLNFGLQDKLANTKLGWDPPAPQGSSASCNKDLTAFYTYYFKSRGIIVHGLLLNNSTTPIYNEVVRNTSGHIANIKNCGAFAGFMEDVGNTTNQISTQLCIDDKKKAKAIAADLGSVSLFYLENGAKEEVPKSDTDGWTFDTKINCFVLSGSWQDKMGSFEIEYKDEGQLVSRVCPNNFDPIEDTIVVTCKVSGQDKIVPQSDSEGWSLKTQNGKKCLIFNGSWSKGQHKCSIEHRNKP